MIRANKIKKFTNNRVDEILIKTFSSHFGIDEDVNLNTKLSDLESFDSLDEVELIMELENKFNIVVNDYEIEEFRDKIKTIRDIKNILKDKYNIIDIKEERKQKITKIIGNK